jgi:hypothetical protein
MQASNPLGTYSVACRYETLPPVPGRRGVVVLVVVVCLMGWAWESKPHLQITHPDTTAHHTLLSIPFYSQPLANEPSMNNVAPMKAVRLDKEGRGQGKGKVDWPRRQSRHATLPTLLPTHNPTLL